MDIIRVSSPEDIAAAEALAAEIWTEHYTPLIGAEQVSYMLERFQSAEAIRDDIEKKGCVYYLIPDTAYCAVRRDGEDLFVSKLYVHKSRRGQGISRLMLEHAVSACPGIRRAWLTVNKGNADSIAAYKKMGFVIEKAVVTDIGGGYVMDDYVMGKIYGNQEPPSRFS